MLQGTPERIENKKAVWSWCFYDWANSAFTTLILTFVYATYFTQSVAADPVKGAASWTFALSLSGLFILVLGPLCGAIADNTGKLKTWIFASSALCLFGTCILALGTPHSTLPMIALILFGMILANTGFELATVFYNALLPNVADASRLGKISSLGWAIGYAGGLFSLIAMLLLFIGVGEFAPLIDLPKENAWHIRIVAPLVVIWFAAFAWPLFAYVPDKIKSLDSPNTAFKKPWGSLKRGFLNLKTDRRWRNFLIGSALYRDGLNTLFAIGGIYAAAKYGLKTSDILLFGIGMNITAGTGAYIASFLEDRLGSFNVVKFSLAGLLIAGICILFSDTKTLFFISALSLGIFVGPVQSASRTLVSKLSDEKTLTENYGFYALTGRAAAFLGPFCYAVATGIFQTQNAGIVSILIFWIIGFLFISRLKDAT